MKPRREHLVFCIALVAAARDARAETMRISLVSMSQAVAGNAVEGILQIVPEAAGADRSTDLAVPARLPGESVVELPGKGRWTVRFDAPGYWSEALLLAAKSGDLGSSHRLRVFPAGTLSGRIVLPPGAKPVASLAVRFHLAPPRGLREPLDTTVKCPVREGRLECAAPAALLDVRIRGEDAFAPVYRWGVKVERGKILDLGSLELRPGASVSGWVEASEGTLSADCEVSLVQETVSHDDLVVTDRLRKGALKVRPNERGFFQLLGVPPGRYVLTAQQPGLAPVSISPIDVRPDLESQVIDRLVLAKPIVLAVEVDPPLEPYGKPWRISLERRAQPSEPPSERWVGEASAEGNWRSPGIPPGTYELSIGGELKARWHSEFIEVRHGDPPLRIDMPVLRIRGVARIGDERLAQTTLWLSQAKGRRLRFDTDDDGRFSGVLPGEGKWHPEIASEAEKLQVFLEPVEVEKPKGKPFAEIEIVVPDTTLLGEVVDDSGRAVPAASVDVFSLVKPQRRSRARSDEKGEFVVRGFLPGAILVAAADRDAESGFVAATLAEGTPSPRLRLVVSKLRAVGGRVFGPAGGVAGARIFVVPNSQSAAGRVAEAVSGPDGRFEIKIPAESSSVELTVFPPGYPLKLTTALVSPGARLEIPLEQQDGTLILELAPDGPSPLVAHDGAWTVGSQLEQWARLQGARTTDPNRLVVPNVEPGAYSLCVGAEAVAALRTGGAPPSAACSTGLLMPNGELVLRSSARGRETSSP